MDHAGPRRAAALVMLIAGLAPAPAQEQETPAAMLSRPGAEAVFRAYLHAYPDLVRDVILVETTRDGLPSGAEWTIQVGTERFRWADGRILPESPGADRPIAEQEYRPHNFSPYPHEIPPPELFTEEQIALIREAESLEAGGLEDCHPAFQGALDGGSSREEVERLLVRVVFLGRPVTVHPLIAESLARADRAIGRAAGEDPATAEFLEKIRSIGGYNWREIRGTGRRSYHAWGLAVDILAEADSRLAVYWMWERERDRDWMLVPVQRRWKPPEAVIRAFENEGFIWGGKWIFYDNMHFEFRPEIHELRRMLQGQEGGVRIIRQERDRDLHHIHPLR